MAKMTPEIQARMPEPTPAPPPKKGSYLEGFNAGQLASLDARNKAIAEADTLRARMAKMEQDIEVMQAALDHLSNATIGPAVLSNICEAGRHEIMARRDYADEARKNTHIWRETDVTPEDPTDAHHRPCPVDPRPFDPAAG